MTKLLITYHPINHPFAYKGRRIMAVEQALEGCTQCTLRKECKSAELMSCTASGRKGDHKDGLPVRYISMSIKKEEKQ